MKIPDMAKHTNPDGTINGVTYMADASGLDPHEIKWMWDRMAHLVRVEKMPVNEARSLMRSELPGKPWLKPDQE